MSSELAGLHDELRGVARRLLGSSSPLRTGGGAHPLDPDLLAASGWAGLEVPSAQGGAGAGFAETAVVVEEMGRVAARSPFLGSAVLGVGLTALLEGGPARDRLLSGAAAGGLQLAVGLTTGDHDGSRVPTPFRLSGPPGRRRLHGRADFVPDAPAADRLLLVSSSDRGPVVVEVPRTARALSVEPQAVLDHTRDLGTVQAEGVAVGEASVLAFEGDPDQAVRRLLDRGALAVSCDSLGLAEAMLEATVDYVAARHQFGRPVGSFQAVKHACADMAVQIALCRELVAAGVLAMEAAGDEAWVAVSMAKAQSGAAAVDVAGSAMQLHGGIGYTWERGVHTFLKRAVLNRSLFGAPAAHRRRLGARYLTVAGPGARTLDRRE